MKKINWRLVIIFLSGLIIGLLIGHFLPTSWSNLSFTQQVVSKSDSLIGQVVEVKANSLTFKTRVKSGENLLIAQKEAKVNDATAIYLLTPKTSSDYFSADYGKKLDQLRTDLKTASSKKDKVAGQKILDQIKALTAEAQTAKNLAVKDLEQKISNLPVGSAERRDAEGQLSELTSNFKYSSIKLSDIQAGASIQVWSDDNFNAQDKFTATKIEVKQ